jgi:uncharacterized Zn-binding protein involved in type VI secretion
MSSSPQKPAARLGDASTPHGLVSPITGGAPTVLIAGQPAARVGDTVAACTMPQCPVKSPALIASGSATVLIGGKPAARIGDTTTHPGASIAIGGASTVRIGG